MILNRPKKQANTLSPEQRRDFLEVLKENKGSHFSIATWEHEKVEPQEKPPFTPHPKPCKGCGGKCDWGANWGQYCQKCGYIPRKRGRLRSAGECTICGGSETFMHGDHKHCSYCGRFA